MTASADRDAHDSSRDHPSPHPAEPHWATLGEEPAYSGRTRIARRRVRVATGEELDFEVDVSAAFAVASLIVVDGEVLLTRQYRYPVDAWIHDLPAGGGAAGEEPIAAARREVEEETGLVPTDLRPLHTLWANPGRSVWPLHLFFGTAVAPGTPAVDDPAEQVRTEWMPLPRLDAMLASGVVVDPTLIVARAMAAATGALPPLGG